MRYYLQLTDRPAPGMLYWEEGKYLFPTRCFHEPDEVTQACAQYLIRVESTGTITADTDGGCDRIRESTDYLELTPENIILKDGRLAGFYLDFGYYYGISQKKPNVHVFPLEETKPYRSDSRDVYTVIVREPGKTYASSVRIR